MKCVAKSLPMPDGQPLQRHQPFGLSLSKSAGSVNPYYSPFDKLRANGDDGAR